MTQNNPLIESFSYFNIKNLVNTTPEEFESHLTAKLNVIDYKSEGYSDEELPQQRDLSIKFHWGHDHDFGSFKIDGRMGSRHIYLLNKFISIFPVSLESFKDKSVLDIGCWTGGTTLLLSQFSDKVTAIEEVKKYADTVSYLVSSFGLENKVQVKSTSLYSLNESEYQDKYDRVYFPGVIYHLSDPVLALRILFNSLKSGGDILIESAGLNHEDAICRFDGNYIYHPDGTRAELNRGGWNYFLVSPLALERMMKEAGFEEVLSTWDDESHRVFAYGKKLKQTGICKAGLSVSDIK